MMTLVNSTYKFLLALRIGFSYAILFFTLTNSAFAEQTVSASNFEDPYLVQNIEADATAANAVEARTKAFEAAQLAGYEELAKRFLSEEALSSFEIPDIKTVERFVQDFEVTNEKLSATRYKGTYDIRFAENTFKNPNSGELYGEAVTPQQTEFLVLPFLEVNNRYYLWQINPFWEAWKRAQANKVLGKIVVPLGSRDDVFAIRDGQNLNYDAATLNAMRIRYNAKQLVIAVARPEPLSDNTLNIAVGLYTPKPYGLEPVRQLSLSAYPGEGTEQLYNRVVATVTQVFHSQGSQTALPDGAITNQQQQAAVLPETASVLTGEKNNILAQFQFSDARQWVETKQAIESINGIDTVQIRSLTSNSATINIHFYGSVDGLRTALNQQGIQLNNAPEGAVFQLTQLRR